MLVEETRTRPVIETDESPAYNTPVVEDLEANEGPALPSAAATAS